MRVAKPPVFDPFARDVSDGSDPDLFSEPVYMDTGFPAPAGIPVVPALSDFNWLEFYNTSGLRYLFQRGIAEWDSTEDSYDVGDTLRDPSDQKFYQLVGTATPATAPSADPTNWYEVLRLPRPMTGETAANAIAAWRNDKGFRITGKDHYGFDAGRILDFKEDWMAAAAAQITATGTGTWFGPWKYRINNGGSTPGGIYANGPWDADLNTHPWGPILGVNSFGASVDAISIVETVKPIIKMSQASLLYEVDFSINGASGPQSNSSFAFGLGDGTLVGSGTVGPTVPLGYGAWLELEAGGSTWSAKAKPNGSAGTGNNTGVAVARDAPHRYRLYVLGTSDSDDSNARVIHMIDGAIVANQTVTLNNQMLYPFVRTAANQGEVCLINLGPLRIQPRLALGDVLL